MKQGSATFIAVIVIPIIVVAAVLLVYWVHSKRKHGVPYESGVDHDSESEFEDNVGNADSKPPQRRELDGQTGVAMSWMEGIRRFFFGTELTLDELEIQGSSHLQSEEEESKNRFDISQWLYMRGDSDELVFVTPRKVDAPLKAESKDLEMVRAGSLGVEGSESDGEDNIDNVHIRVQKGKGLGSGDNRSVTLHRTQRISARELYGSEYDDDEMQAPESTQVSASRNMGALLGNDLFQNDDDAAHY